MQLQIFQTGLRTQGSCMHITAAAKVQHQLQHWGAGDRFFKAFAGGHQCSKFEQQRRSAHAQRSRL